MDVDLQKRLFEEITGYVRDKSTSLAAGEMRYPASAYYDAGQLEREKRMFQRFPLIVGHSDELSEPGEYLAGTMLDIPYLIVRQKDGSLRAFRNVCSHRGAPVCAEGKGKAGQFVCPYHAWTYSLDGSLRGAPRNAFPGLDRAGSGLSELAVIERHGLVWLRLDGSEMAFEAFTGGLDEELASFDLGSFVLERRETYEADINWKSVLDGFLEVYHFSPLHSNSIGPWFYANTSAFERLSLNGRMVGVRKSIDALVGTEFAEGVLMEHIAVNYQLFPNTVIVWQGDHFEIWSSFPGDEPGKCRVHFMMLVAADAKDALKNRWDRNMSIIRQTVMDEDWAMSEKVQKGLPFIRNNEVVFGANEPALQHFYANLADQLERAN
jgi:phenylpropionate dioxygenase-like ring-hydroxylating dioxygenase large terminal subunit